MWRKLRYRLRPRRSRVVQRKDKLSVRMFWTESAGPGLRRCCWEVEAKAPGGGYLSIGLFERHWTALLFYWLVNLVEIVSAPDRRGAT